MDSFLFVSLISWSMLRKGKELWSMLANGSCLTYCPERNLNHETGDGLEDAEKQTFGRWCGEAARVEMCTRHTTSRQSNGRAWPSRRRNMWTLNGQKAVSLTDICWLDPPEQDGGCWAFICTCLVLKSSLCGLCPWKTAWRDKSDLTGNVCFGDTKDLCHISASRSTSWSPLRPAADGIQIEI